MNHHDLPTDEIRRQLRAIDRANTEVMPRWRAVLARIVGPEDATLTADQKAAVLGVPSPSRRTLFRFGSATIIGAAVLSACGDDDDDASGTTAGAATTTDGGPATTSAITGPGSTEPAATDAATTEPGATEPTETTAGGGDEMDLVLARTAASLEKLAVDAYSAAGALLTTPAIIDAATLFADHHQQHLDALNGVITGAGGDEVTEMNQAVFDVLVAPALDAAATEADAVELALQLEEAAAQTYVFAGGALSVPALRSTIMTIGGIEARHAAVLRMAALGQPPIDVFPDQRAFWPGSNPLAGIDGALITE